MSVVFGTVGVLLLVAAIVRGGASPRIWLLFRWRMTRLLTVIAVIAAVLMGILYLRG